MTRAAPLSYIRLRPVCRASSRDGGRSGGSEVTRDPLTRLPAPAGDAVMNRVLLEPPPTLSDERLAKLSAEGIDSAFAMLVLRHRRALVFHCAELVGTADAEEAVQEALLRAYLALARGESVNHVGPWLRTIAHNAALNLLRARRSRPAVSREDPAHEAVGGDAFERRQSLRAVVSALEELPERQRRALVMRELEGRSYAEIEARLNTSNGAVRQLLNRARMAVRERLDALAGLVPAVRWIVADGGGAGTAARLGALSGGCAVTIKLCTAMVLTAVLAPGAPLSNPLSTDRQKAGVSERMVERSAPFLSQASRSTRSAFDARQPTSARSSRLLSASMPTGSGPGRSWGDRQATGPRSQRSTSGASGAAMRGPGGEARAGSGAGPAPTPGSGAGGSTRPALQMGPNAPLAAANPGAGTRSPTSTGSGSPTAIWGSPTDGAAATGGTSGSATGARASSTAASPNETSSSNGSDAGAGQPRAGTGSS